MSQFRILTLEVHSKRHFSELPIWGSNTRTLEVKLSASPSTSINSRCNGKWDWSFWLSQRTILLHCSMSSPSLLNVNDILFDVPGSCGKKKREKKKKRKCPLSLSADTLMGLCFPVGLSSRTTEITKVSPYLACCYDIIQHSELGRKRTILMKLVYLWPFIPALLDLH
jgi:hypothetical protein